MSTLIYDKSVFKKYFESTDAEVVAWVDNVVIKLFEKGIVPSYILRGQGDQAVDDDYNAFWTAMATFYAYFVKLARVFDDFKDDDYLAAQYLTNLNTFVNDTETIERLQFIISNRLRDISKRGTLKSITPSTILGEADGELLRLIGYRDGVDFFKLGVARPQHNGWNANNSSPCYRGCTGRYDLNIGYEYSEDVLDLSVYPIINEAYVSLSTFRGRNCMEIEGVPVGEEAGIGLSDIDKAISINPNQNFEITLEIAQDVTYENITFGCLAFDIDGNEVPLYKVTDGTPYNYFFETRRLNQAGKFYFVRGIIYHQDQEFINNKDAELNIGFGHNLKFNDRVVKILPKIVVDNDMNDDSDDSQDNFDSTSVDFDEGSAGVDESGSWSDAPYDSSPSVFLWNIKVTPCSLEYERCYLNNKNFIDIIGSNNNAKYNELQITDLLRRYFIPYNAAFAMTYLPPVDAVSGFILQEDGFFILDEDSNAIALE